MKKKSFLTFAIVWFTCLTGCKILPLTGIYRYGIADGKSIKTLESGFDITYAVDFNVAKKPADDYISFTLVNTVRTYRLDFYACNEIKTVIADFLALHERAVKNGLKNGIEHIGDSLLYCYVISEEGGSETVTRADAVSGGKNTVEFSFLVKDNVSYLVLNKFRVQTIYGKEKLNSWVESIPFSYGDIKKLYDVMTDEGNVNKVRRITEEDSESETALAIPSFDRMKL